MSRFWEEDPNHYAEWGEKGGLPVDPRTIHKTYSANGRYLLSTDRRTVTKGGTGGNLPINATEQQEAREVRDGMTPARQ